MPRKKKTEEVVVEESVDVEEEVKNKLGDQPNVLPIEGDPQGDVSKDDGIEIGEPMDLRPKALPLVVKVPESASSAQKEYAKILNAYAYQNPRKWGIKKDKLVKRLKMLAGKEVPGDPKAKLSLRGSVHSFRFIKMGKEGEIYAEPEHVGTDDGE